MRVLNELREEEGHGAERYLEKYINNMIDTKAMGFGLGEKSQERRKGRKSLVT
jgi:hypothetical protein